MSSNKRAISPQAIALLMIGIGLISMASMIYLLLPKTSSAAEAAPQDFSTVPVEVNFDAPALDLTLLDGTPVSLSDLRGEVVLVNLWATWCPPCREEMPTLQAFYEEYKDEGFTLIGINQEEPREVVEPFVSEFGLTFPIWLDLEYLAEREFNTSNLPSSYVVDRSGTVRLMWIGGISKAVLDQFVPEIILE